MSALRKDRPSDSSDGNEGEYRYQGTAMRMCHRWLKTAAMSLLSASGGQKCHCEQQARLGSLRRIPPYLLQ
jgi:hypothetical protein